MHLSTYTLVNSLLQTVLQAGNTQQAMELSTLTNALEELSNGDKLEQEMLAKNVHKLEIGISTMDICADEVMRLCAVCACW
jgi:hypothetical protein